MNNSVIPETPESTAVLNVTAAKWELVSDGLYQCTFIGIMKYVTNTSGEARVFIVDDNGNEELNISQAPTHFSGGEISASNDSNNIQISFKTGAGKAIPFTYLNLKIVFE